MAICGAQFVGQASIYQSGIWYINLKKNDTSLARAVQSLFCPFFSIDCCRMSLSHER